MILEHTRRCIVKGTRVNYTIIGLMVVYEHRNYPSWQEVELHVFVEENKDWVFYRLAQVDHDFFLECPSKVVEIDYYL